MRVLPAIFLSRPGQQRTLQDLSTLAVPMLRLLQELGFCRVWGRDDGNRCSFRDLFEMAVASPERRMKTPLSAEVSLGGRNRCTKPELPSRGSLSNRRELVDSQITSGVHRRREIHHLARNRETARQSVRIEHCKRTFASFPVFSAHEPDSDAQCRGSWDHWLFSNTMAMSRNPTQSSSRP